jgi:hypothetical protein
MFEFGWLAVILIVALACCLILLTDFMILPMPLQLPFPPKLYRREQL